MTDPRMDPAGESGQEGGSNPPVSSGQQPSGAGSPGQGVPGQGSQGQGQGRGFEGQNPNYGSPGGAGSATPGASSVGTATRTTQPASTGIPAQSGEPTAGRARAGREPAYDYGYGYETESASYAGDSNMLAKAARWSWAALLLGGLGMIALGICLLVWPHASLTVVAILVGAALVVSGLVKLYEGFTAHDQSGGMRAAYVVIGLLAVLAGVYCLRHHAISLFVVAFVTGVYFIAHGIADIGVASSVPGSGRGLRAVLGVFSIVAGLLMVVWPAITLILFLTLVAAWLLFYGVALCMLAFGVRRAAKEVSKEPTSTAAMPTPAQAA